MPEQDGRVALVTGGSQGIGRGAALALAQHGSAVVVHGLDLAGAEQTVAEITAGGGRAAAVAGPIDDPETTESAVRAALHHFGALDILVTSAGIQRYGDVPSTSLHTWNEVFAVNVTGVFLAAKAALPALRRSGAGAIVIVSSVQATATQTQVAAYTASKGALLSLTRSLAVDEAAHGVRVNSVSPGSVDTPMLRASAALFGDGTGQGVEDVLADWGTAHALGRIARAEEIGEVVSFLAGPRASFVTGAELRVDGGLLARLAAAVPPSNNGDTP
ncbi:SDR family NAD(P)-dependent oxidoreductase [Leifsonia sp. NPDC058230]|uniref:SDR family NAD(P)-dependent oxidoreductase n=1 Tax=Leifsonia sp. NPDC058230 TaxID=3346391 RepID=UPI0036D8B2E2